MQQIQLSRERRIKEIDQQIESIKDELNKYTGSVDQLQSRKRVSKPKPPPPDNTSMDAESTLIAAISSATISNS